MGLCAAVGLLLGIGYLFVATPIYTSTARMSLTAANRTADSQSFNDGTNSYLYTQSELMMSPSVLALAAQEPEVAKILEGELDKIQYLQRYMAVDVGKRDTVLTVSFSSTDPNEASIIANGIVAAYQKYQVTPRQSDSAELTRLTQETASLEKHITDTTSQMQDLERENGALDPQNPHNTLADHTLSELTHELTVAQIEQLKARNDSNAATAYIEKLKKKGVDVDSVDGEMLGMSPDFRGSACQLTFRSFASSFKNSRYLPSHPQYKMRWPSACSILELTQARLMQNHYEIASAKVADLTAAVKEASRNASKVNTASMKYARLQTDLNNDQKRKDVIAGRLQQVNEARALGMLDIEMLESAQPESRPSHPSKKAALPVSLMLGDACRLRFGLPP